MNTNINTPSGGERPPAVVQAEAGAQAWREVARGQRAAVPRHSDFYSLAGELVSTLYAVEDLVHLLAGQLEGYGEGRRLYDDSRQVDPSDRLIEAVAALGDARAALAAAGRAVNDFWSAIGHIGVEDDR